MLTLACSAGYVWAGMSGFDAAVHAMSTLATGGMANYDSSFAGFSPAAQYVGTVFMLIGSLTFVRFVQFARGDARRALARQPDPGLPRSSTLSFVAAWSSRALLQRRRRSRAGGPRGRLQRGLDHLLDRLHHHRLRPWGPLAETLFFCAMMVGGCTGSTAGGLKVFRYELLARAVAARSAGSTARHRLRARDTRATGTDGGDGIGDRLLDVLLPEPRGRRVALVLIGLDPVTAISGAAASLGNVGPGLGPVHRPGRELAGLHDAAKWVCSVPDAGRPAGDPDRLRHGDRRVLAGLIDPAAYRPPTSLYSVRLYQVWPRLDRANGFGSEVSTAWNVVPLGLRNCARPGLLNAYIPSAAARGSRTASSWPSPHRRRPARAGPRSRSTRALAWPALPARALERPRGESS